MLLAIVLPLLSAWARAQAETRLDTAIPMLKVLLVLGLQLSAAES